MRKSSIIAVGVLTAGLIVVPGVAMASNGGAWLLGRSNTETAATTVTNSAGTPLSLRAKAGTAPLAVNSNKVVANLNADMVDGVHVSSLARTTGKTGTVVHDGTWDGWGAKCPAGTVFVSGGGYAKYGSAIYYSGPDWDVNTHVLVPNSWIVLDDSGVGVSNVTCYSPTGAAIAGAAQTVDDAVGNGMYAAQRVEGPSYPSPAGTAKLDQFKAAQGQSKR